MWTGYSNITILVNLIQLNNGGKYYNISHMPPYMYSLNKPSRYIVVNIYQVGWPTRLLYEIILRIRHNARRYICKKLIEIVRVLFQYKICIYILSSYWLYKSLIVTFYLLNYGVECLWVISLVNVYYTRNTCDYVTNYYKKKKSKAVITW